MPIGSYNQLKGNAKEIFTMKPGVGFTEKGSGKNSNKFTATWLSLLKAWDLLWHQTFAANVLKLRIHLHKKNVIIKQVRIKQSTSTAGGSKYQEDFVSKMSQNYDFFLMYFLFKDSKNSFNKSNEVIVQDKFSLPNATKIKCYWNFLNNLQY